MVKVSGKDTKPLVGFLGEAIKFTSFFTCIQKKFAYSCRYNNYDDNKIPFLIIESEKCLNSTCFPVRNPQGK